MNHVEKTCQKASAMPDEARILELLRDVLESGSTPEEACSGSPELLGEVRKRLQSCREFEAEIEALFPSWESMLKISAGRHGAGAHLPQIPGYELERVLGRGGMGVVYKARHLKLRRSVALKMMLSGPHAGRNELNRFMREAEAVAALRHEHIVQVYDVGDFDGSPYFTMEYVEGGTLAERLAGVPQPALQAAALVARLATAAQVAHYAGILHRDLKPANVLMTADGTPKISDFGLARRLNDEPSLTLTGARMGTPSYMAPEQVVGKHDSFGPAVDIYALGALLYEMLTGRPPFRGESASDTERQVLEQEPVPPSRLNAKVPRDLDTICLKCLQKGPSRRYETAGHVAADLDRFLSGNPIVARPVGAAERVVKWARRRPALAILVGTLLLAVAGAIGFGTKIERLENTRRIEFALREARSRQAVETALSLVIDLRRSERWVEADNVTQDARSRLTDANSPQLRTRFDRVVEDLRIARELQEIRQRYAEPTINGYNFFPANIAYSNLFARIGIGPQIPDGPAASVVRASPVREELLAGLENAAFVARVVGNQAELERLLAVARLADPEPSWGDRFRDPGIWRSREGLLKLVDDARSSGISPAAHQMVIIGVLLNRVGANADTITVLREAHNRDPGDFWLNLEMGNALQRAKKSSEACRYYHAALAVRPTNYVVWHTLAEAFQGAGETGRALVALRKATDLNPRFVVAWYNLIGGLASAGRWDEATAAHRMAVELNPAYADFLQRPYVIVFVADARALAAKKKWSAAADGYAQAFNSKLTDQSEVWFETAAVQLLSGHFDDYRRTCEHMLKQCREGTARPFLAARACTLAPCTTERLLDAAHLSSNELRQAGSEHWSLTEQGALCCRSGRFADAIPLFERSIAANPKEGAAVINWLWLAIAHDKLGHADEAKRWLKKATTWLDQLGPEFPPNPERLSFHLHSWLEAQILLREAAGAPIGK
jgi:serine/threonine-protein kinase